jgi:REP element-mobilizing transposase RayT
MPDHVHFFCAPCPDSGSLGNWMGFWRSHVTRALGVGRGSLWQREYWDRQLRRHESYADAWEYVRQNPARAGLVERSEDWAYQGEINVLEWLG